MDNITDIATRITTKQNFELSEVYALAAHVLRSPEPLGDAQTYDEIRKARCEWCAKGFAASHGSHWCGHGPSILFRYQPCTAPTPEQVIKEQGREIRRLQAELKTNIAVRETAETERNNHMQRTAELHIERDEIRAQLAAAQQERDAQAELARCAEARCRSWIEERNKAEQSSEARAQEVERLQQERHRLAEIVAVNRARRGLGYVIDPDWCYSCDRPKDDCACEAAAFATPNPSCHRCGGTKVEFGALSGWPHVCRVCHSTTPAATPAPEIHFSECANPDCPVGCPDSHCGDFSDDAPAVEHPDTARLDWLEKQRENDTLTVSLNNSNGCFEESPKGHAVYSTESDDEYAEISAPTIRELIDAARSAEAKEPGALSTPAPDYCETDETAHWLKAEDIAKESL